MSSPREMSCSSDSMCKASAILSPSHALPCHCWHPLSKPPQGIGAHTRSTWVSSCPVSLLCCLLTAEQATDAQTRLVFFF
jgi:hypothetical protein